MQRVAVALHGKGIGEHDREAETQRRTLRAPEGGDDPLLERGPDLEQREGRAEQGEQGDDQPGIIGQQEGAEQGGAAELDRGDNRQIGPRCAVCQRRGRGWVSHHFRPFP